VSVRAVVAYATKHGGTGQIASLIAERLRTHGLEVDLRAAADVRIVADYDFVIVGSAVYMNRWQRDGIELLQRLERDYVGRPVWLFSSGPTGGTPEADAQVARQLAMQPRAPGDAGRFADRIRVRGHATFGGHVDDTMGGIFERWMPRGDWRDQAAIEAWADAIAEAVAPPTT
jgi:menaquinone-dependent protoporphyrinogen oxidase